MNNLARIRKSFKISQGKLAELVGVCMVEIWRYENIDVIPRVDVALKIARVFNTTVEEVWG